MIGIINTTNFGFKGFYGILVMVVFYLFCLITMLDFIIWLVNEVFSHPTS